VGFDGAYAGIPVEGVGIRSLSGILGFDATAPFVEARTST
jgi:hypothetical protein